MLFKKKKSKVQNVQSFSEIKCSTETKNMSEWPCALYYYSCSYSEHSVSVLETQLCERNLSAL